MLTCRLEAGGGGRCGGRRRGAGPRHNQPMGKGRSIDCYICPGKWRGQERGGGESLKLQSDRRPWWGPKSPRSLGAQGQDTGTRRCRPWPPLLGVSGPTPAASPFLGSPAHPPTIVGWTAPPAGNRLSCPVCPGRRSGKLQPPGLPSLESCQHGGE